MAFGDKISGGKNNSATGVSAVNKPSLDVWVRLQGSTDLVFIASVNCTIDEAFHGVGLLFGEILLGVEIMPYTEE